MPSRRFSQILVVEDRTAAGQRPSQILQRDGFHVTATGSAAEALAEMREKNYGAAVVDFGLPALDGPKLLGEIHALNSQVQVIVYTDASSFAALKEAVNLGVFAVVETRDDPSELLRQMHRALRERVGLYAADLETAVRRRTEELARSNRELADFASVVAHDLRSPLLTISGYSQILKEEYGPRLDAGAEQYIREIVAGVARMSRLIEDLLSYSRVGRKLETLVPVELAPLVGEVLADLVGAIQESQARVETAALPTVLGIRTQLVELFQNLLSNAIKFRRDEPPRVVLSAAACNGFWEFAVCDNGIGIEPEHFQRIFQVFHRLHGQQYEGTGIGLAICKKIVDLHGGRIWVTSQPGVGTTFHFTLPAKAGDEGSY